MVWFVVMRSRVFMDKRISQEVEGDSLGDEFKGYIFRWVVCCL